MNKFKIYLLFMMVSCFLLFIGIYITDNFSVSQKIRKLIYKPRIFCLILTSATNFNTRTRSIYETWAPKCDNYKFVMVISEDILNKTNLKLTNDTLLNGFEITFDNMNLFQPPNYTIDRYNKLTDKIYKSFKYLYNNYNDYDWYLKADDDTYVFVDNLRKFLSNKNRSDPITYGYDFNCYVDKGYKILQN